jgi:GTP-binding protein
MALFDLHLLLALLNCFHKASLITLWLQADSKKKEGPTPVANIKSFKLMLAADWEALPWCFETSSKTGQGKTELLGYLASVREMYRRTGGK